ncbi:hypothetical protein H0X06_04940 [Candidatus Dependentiae bacterium]|nr:hypothetical protein [Candidatus Dependentiae bacterium]
MNILIESQEIVSSWLTSIHSRVESQQSGHYKSPDTANRPLILGWVITDILSSNLAVFKKNVSDIAAQTHAISEVQFLQTHPEAVSHDLFLKSCEPLFVHGVASVDWKEVEDRIQSTYKQFYVMDIAHFGHDIIKRIADDLYVIVTVKEAASASREEPEKIVGFLMAAITPELAQGDIKLIKLALDPAHSDGEAGELLMSSLFKIIPEVKRIFTSIRPTDENALQTYFSWGFTYDYTPVQDPNHPINLEYWTVLEYKTNKSDRLQQTTKTLVS